MKRILLHVSLMLVTFFVGLTADWLVTRPRVDHAPELTKTMAAPITAINLPVFPPVPINKPTPHLIFDYDQEKYYLGGDFLLLGRPPKEFAEIKSFALWSTGNGAQSSGDLELLVHSDNPSGSMYDVEHAVFVLVTQRRLFFATSEGKNGFAYRFDGEFLRTNMVAVSDENIPVLRGTLTKMKNGRRVAERVMKFGLHVHGC